MIFKNKEVDITLAPTFVDPKTNNPISPEQCIFLDIETVSGEFSYTDLSPILQKRWENKVNNWLNYSENSRLKILDAIFSEFEKNKSQDLPSNYLYDLFIKSKEISYDMEYKKIAGLFPEYGKIICVTLGFYKNGDFQKLSFVGPEYMLLANFLLGFISVYDRLSNNNKSKVWIVGHNISFFDKPYLTKRLAINGFSVPFFFDKFRLEPWNNNIIDTATEWRDGSTTGDATLETICNVLNIPSPKSDLSGDKISEFYYNKDYDENRIVEYCENDVQAVHDLFKYLQNLKTIKK